MNILNSLTPRQQASLQAMATEYNSAAKTNFTVEEYAELNLINQINAKTAAGIAQAAALITTAAAALSEDQQDAMIKLNQDFLSAKA